MTLCLVCTVICAQLGLQGPFSFFRDHNFTLICYTFPNTILRTTAQLWQDNTHLFLSTTEQQLTPLRTLFITAVKLAVKQAFRPQCSHFLQQNFNKQWTASSLHVSCFCEQTKTISGTVVAGVCKNLTLTTAFHHLL